MSSLAQLWPEAEQSAQVAVYQKMSFFPKFEYLLEITYKEHTATELDILADIHRVYKLTKFH
jgi:hypothetical protein